MRTKSRGTSLVEAVVALALLVLAGLTIVSVLPDAMRLDRHVEAEMLHMSAAQQKLDDLMLANAAVGVTWTSSQSDHPHGNTCGCIREWRGRADETGVTGVQVLEVRVTWTDAGRQSQTTLYGMVAP